MKLLDKKSQSSSKSSLFPLKRVVATEVCPGPLNVLKKAPSSRSQLSGKMEDPEILFRGGKPGGNPAK